MRRLRGGSSRTLSGETCPASAGGERLRSRRRGGRKRPPVFGQESAKAVVAKKSL